MSSIALALLVPSCSSPKRSKCMAAQRTGLSVSNETFAFESPRYVSIPLSARTYRILMQMQEASPLLRSHCQRSKKPCSRQSFPFSRAPAGRPTDATAVPAIPSSYDYLRDTSRLEPEDAIHRQLGEGDLSLRAMPRTLLTLREVILFPQYLTEWKPAVARRSTTAMLSPVVVR